MKNTSLVTIGILCFNQKDLVIDAIDSVINQSYDNIELIVFDDGSSDGTVETLKEKRDELYQRFNRVEMVFNDENGGNIAKNENEIINRSNGEYIYILAGDDLLFPDFVTKCVEYLGDHQEIDIVMTNGITANEHYQLAYGYDFEDIFFKSKPDLQYNSMYYRVICNNFLFAQGMLIRKNLYSKIGLHDESIKYEDYEFWIRCCKNNVRIEYIPEILAVWRRAETSLTYYKKNTKEKIDANIDAEFKAKEKYINDFDKKRRDLIVAKTILNFLQTCKNNNYYNGIVKLKKYAEKHNIKTDLNNLWTVEKPVSSLLGWQTKEFNVWCINEYFKKEGINHIAVYGYGLYGKRIVNAIEMTAGSLDYIIDKACKEDDLHRIYRPNDELPEVDMVVIALTYEIDSIKTYLQKKVRTRILTLDDFVYNIYRIACDEGD